MSKPKQSRPEMRRLHALRGLELEVATIADYGVRLLAPGRRPVAPWPGFDHAECPVPTQWDRVAGFTSERLCEAWAGSDAAASESLAKF
jgi:hypothetical protein